MSWVEAAWVAMSAASLTLGIVHLFVWFKQKSQVAHLLFFALAASATAFGVFELAMMHSPSPVAYAAMLRWAHVPLAMFVLSSTRCAATPSSGPMTMCGRWHAPPSIQASPMTT
jgi:two-component system, LuxR family, sensor kinase FixL